MLVDLPGPGNDLARKESSFFARFSGILRPPQRSSGNHLMNEVTQILTRIDEGDPQAADQLLPLVYDELRRLAAAMLANEQPGQTLQPTALVHEAWLRLVGNQEVRDQKSEVSASERVPASPTSDLRRLTSGPAFRSRTHFFAAAAEAMRRILVDQARRKATAKHGGQLTRQQLLDSDIATAAPADEVIAVHEALDALAAKDALTSDLIKLRYFGGFSLEEAGELLGMSRATAYRLWTYGRAWLRAELSEKESS